MLTLPPHIANRYLSIAAPCRRCGAPRESVMAGDPSERCLSCYAADQQRYNGRSQRVGQHAWEYEPAEKWLRDRGYLPGHYRRERRDHHGWHSRRREHAPVLAAPSSVAEFLSATLPAVELAERFATDNPLSLPTTATTAPVATTANATASVTSTTTTITTTAATVTADPAIARAARQLRLRLRGVRAVLDLKNRPAVALRRRLQDPRYCHYCETIHTNTPACPSLVEIAERAAAIRRTWSPRLAIKRQGMTPLWDAMHGHDEWVAAETVPFATTVDERYLTEKITEQYQNRIE